MARGEDREARAELESAQAQSAALGMQGVHRLASAMISSLAARRS